MVLGILGAIATGIRLAGAATAATATAVATGAQAVAGGIATFAAAAKEFGGELFTQIGGLEGTLKLAQGVAPLFINPLVNVNEQRQLDQLGAPILPPQGFGGPGGSFLVPTTQPGQSFFPSTGGIVPGRQFPTPGDTSVGLIGQIVDFFNQGEPLFNLGPGNGGPLTNGAAAGQCAQLFRAGGVATARPMRTIIAINPGTGKPEFWEHKGRPILYTSDLRAAKRVRKIARRARSASRSFR